MQSKLKAEALGLEETDVVLDQAIYAKAIEILLNPSFADLKSFIVVRMGAFHIICTFLAVIGKRFAHGGLRDLIIESGMLGIVAFFLDLSSQLNYQHLFLISKTYINFSVQVKVQSKES